MSEVAHTIGAPTVSFTSDDFQVQSGKKAQNGFRLTLRGVDFPVSLLQAIVDGFPIDHRSIGAPGPEPKLISIQKISVI